MLHARGRTGVDHVPPQSGQQVAHFVMVSPLATRLCVVNCNDPRRGVRARCGLPRPFRNDAEVLELGHQPVGVERQETCHTGQCIARHTLEMRKPFALNAWKIERGEAPNDIKVRKLRAQDCLGQRPPVLHTNQARGCNLVIYPSDITDRSGLAGVGVQQTGFLISCSIVVVWPG